MAKRGEVYDINKFPNQEGLLVFGISMSKIAKEQSAKNCFKQIETIAEKIKYPHVGLNFIYSDSLYLPNTGNPFLLNKKYQSVMINHKNEFEKILERNSWYIRKAFNFMCWNQAAMLSKNFMNYLAKLKKFYEKDQKLQRYVKADLREVGKRINKGNISFILEEILMFYLVSMGEIKLPNEYLQGKEKWILWCYPGKPLKSEIYIYKKNILKKVNVSNKYSKSFYDLEENKLYNYEEIDLEKA